MPVAVLAWAHRSTRSPPAILAVTIPILILFMILVGRGAREQARRRWRALALLSAHFLDVVSGLATLRAYRREEAQAETLAEVGERYRAETMGTLRVAFLSAFVLELCAMIGTALVAATIGVQLAGGHLALAAGLTVLLLAPELYGPLREVGQQFHAAPTERGASERIFAALDAAARDRRARPRAATRPRRPARVRCCARARHATPTPGGPSRSSSGSTSSSSRGDHRAGRARAAAGKSTIARLADAPRRPGRAAPSAAAAPTCARSDLRGWREQIAWVPQRPQLFAGTVAENMLLGADRRDRRRCRPRR